MAHLSPTGFFISIAIFLALLVADWWVSDLSTYGGSPSYGRERPLRMQTKRLWRWQISTKDVFGEEVATLAAQCSAAACPDEASFVIQESYDDDPQRRETYVYAVCDEHARDALANLARSQMGIASAKSPE